MQFIYNVLFTSCMYGRVRFTRVERLMQIAELNLRPRDGKVFRDLLRLARTRRRDVTRGDGVGRLARGPWRTGRGAWIGLRGYSGVLRCAAFKTCVLLSAVNCGGRAENARALCKDEGRERPSLMLNGGRAENARALDGSEGREYPSLPYTDSKTENVRAFGIMEISQDHPYSLRISERKDQDSCSRQHPCYQPVGSDLVLIAPRWAVLYSRLGYGVVAARGGLR